MMGETVLRCMIIGKAEATVTFLMEHGNECRIFLIEVWIPLISCKSIDVCLLKTSWGSIKNRKSLHLNMFLETFGR